MVTNLTDTCTCTCMLSLHFYISLHLHLLSQQKLYLQLLHYLILGTILFVSWFALYTFVHSPLAALPSDQYKYNLKKTMDVSFFFPISYTCNCGYMCMIVAIFQLSLKGVSYYKILYLLCLLPAQNHQYLQVQ